MQKEAEGSRKRQKETEGSGERRKEAGCSLTKKLKEVEKGVREAEGS